MKFTVATQKVKYYCTPKIPDDMRRNESDLEGEKLVKYRNIVELDSVCLPGGTSARQTSEINIQPIQGKSNSGEATSTSIPEVRKEESYIKKRHSTTFGLLQIFCAEDTAIWRKFFFRLSGYLQSVRR